MWILAIALSLLAWAEKQPVTTTDLLKIRKVTAVKIAPNGAFAVYAVQSIHTEKDQHSYRTHLWFIDLNGRGAKPRQLTFGDRNDSGIAISPDGKSLAFVRAGEKGLGQVWIMPLTNSGEARPLTRLEYGAASPVWHPKKPMFLVTSPTPLSKIEAKPHFDQERPRRGWLDADIKGDANPDGDRKAIRNWLEQNSTKGNPVTINRLSYQGEMGLENEMRITHLYNVDLGAEAKTTQLTKDSTSLNNCSYSPTGDSIVCTGSPAGRQHPDRERRNAIYLLNADGSGVHPILDIKEESSTPTPSSSTMDKLSSSRRSSRMNPYSASPASATTTSPRVAWSGSAAPGMVKPRMLASPPTARSCSPLLGTARSRCSASRAPKSSTWWADPLVSVNTMKPAGASSTHKSASPTPTNSSCVRRTEPHAN